MQPNFSAEALIMPKYTSMTRRTFAKLMGAGAATAVARPAISWPREMLSSSVMAAAASAALVRLNSNENPYGPSPMALKAMTDAFSLAWRYPDEHADTLIDTIAKINGVTREQIVLGDGSGEILKVCASAFTGPMTNDSKPIELAKPTRGPALQFVPGRGKLVAADPT